MTTVDSLDIQITSSAKQANDAIDSLIKNLGKLGNSLNIDTSKISNIGKNIDLSNVTNGAKEIQSKMESVAKSVGAPMKDFSKSFADIEKKYKDLGKGFEVKGSTADILKQITKYSNALEYAKVKKQELELAGKTEGQKYENAVKDVIKYANQIDSLESQLKRVQSLHSQPVEVQLHMEEEQNVQAQIEEIKRPIEDFETWLSNFQAKNLELNYGFNTEDMQSSVQGMIDSLKTSMSELQSSFPDAESTISAYEQELKQLKNIYEEVRLTMAQSVSKIETPKVEMSGLDELKLKLQSVVIAAQELNRAGEQVSLKESLESAFSQIALGAMHIGENLRNAGNNIRNFKAELQDLRASGERISLGASLIDAVTPIHTIDRIKEKFASLQNQVSAFDASGIRKIDEDGAISSKRIARLSDELIELKNRLKELSSQGYGLGFKEFDDATVKIQRIESELARYKSGLTKLFDQLQNSISTLNGAFSGIIKKLRNFGAFIGSAVSKLGKLTKSMLLLNTATRKSGGAFNLNFKTILKYAFGIRSTFVLINKLRSAIKDGFKNLVQYSDEVNRSVSTLNSSLKQFKNASAAAVSPLLNAIAPALNSLIQLFIRATNAVNQFFSALTGKNTWIRAKYVYEDVADSISGAAKAAKGALQPFDALNNLTTQDSGGADVGDLFETLPLEDKFKDLADWIKGMWDNADFYDLGRKIGEEIQHGLANIPWDKIKSTARKLGKSLATLLNGLIEVNGLGKAIGYSLAQAINTAYKFLNAFVHNLHWESIGKFIADSINGFIQNIDWALIRDTLITGAKGLADAINAFVDYLDWDSVASTISNAINALSDTIIMFFERVDWYELGQKIGYTLEKAIEDIDFKRVGRAIADVIQSALDFVSGIISQLSWDEIKNAIKDLFDGFFGNIKIPDNLQGIVTALVALKGAMVGLNGVIKVSKIAKAFNEISTAAKGLKNLKIASVFKDLKSVFSDALGAFKNSFAVSGDLFASFKNGLSGLSSGMEAFRASLSPVTKGVVGLVAVFSEFKVVGNAFDDILKGSDNLSASIGKIVAAVTAAGAALSVVFGVPTGIIIAGVTAAVAGLKSLNDHFNELEVERVGQRIKDSLTNPDGVSLDSIVDQYADAFAEMRGQFTNIADQASKVDMLDDSIQNVYTDIDQIRVSMENGVISVEEGTERLSLLFEELEQVTADKFGAIEDTLYGAFGQNGAYRDVLETMGVDTQQILAEVSGLSVDAQDKLRELNELQLTLDPFSEEYQAIEEQKRAITGGLDDVTQAFNKFQNDINAIDIDYASLVDDNGELSKGFETTMMSLVESASAYQDAVSESTVGVINSLTEAMNSALAMGDTERAAIFEATIADMQKAGQNLETQAGETAKQVTDRIQSDFIDAISQQIEQAAEDWEELSTAEKLWMSITQGIDSQDAYVKAQIDAFKANTLDPMSQQIDEALTQLGVDGAGWAEEATQQIIDGLFDTEMVRTNAGQKMLVSLNDDWNSIFDTLKTNVVPQATEAGQNIVAGIAEGMTTDTNAFDGAAQTAANVAVQAFNAAAGIHSPAEIMKPSGQNMLLGIVEGFKNKFDAFTAPIQTLITQISSKFTSGLQTVKNLWSSAWNSLPSAMNNVFNSILSNIQSFISKVSSAFSGIKSKIGSAFSGIAGGAKTLSLDVTGNMPTISVPTINIPQYAAGGFPQQYSLFMAGENGVPELLGTQGGKTAVAGGAEITGIADAVYSTGQTEASLLQTAVSLLQMIAEKPSLSGGDIFNAAQSEYRQRANRGGYTKDPVWG